MKNTNKMFVSIILSLLLVVSTFPNFAQQAQAAQSEDFTYELINDDTNVSIIGYTGRDTDVSIPSTINDKVVASIGDSAFLLCKNITSITIPYGVTSIANNAFSQCISLTSIIIPDSVISIGDSVFNLCERLITVTIPNSVSSIGKGVFCDCRSLKTITIPNSVTVIGRKPNQRNNKSRSSSSFRKNHQTSNFMII